MSRQRFVPLFAALVPLACGSSESGLFGRTSSGTGGFAAAAGGSAGFSWASGGLPSQSGGSPGNGGVLNGGTSNGGVANGGIPNGGTSNGGIANGGASNGGIPNGGTSNGGIANGGASDGGTMSGGDTGAGGISPDSGVRVDGGRPVTFPSGGVISQDCANCVTANCQAESRTCQADPPCWDMGLCVTRCILPLQCAACFVGNQQASAEFSAVQCCAMQHCSMCPSLGGLVACP